MRPSPMLAAGFAIAGLGHAAWAAALLPGFSTSLLFLSLGALAFLLLAGAAARGAGLPLALASAAAVYLLIAADQAFSSTGPTVLWGTLSFVFTLLGLAAAAWLVPRGSLSLQAALGVAALGPLGWTLWDLARGLDAYYVGNLVTLTGMVLAAWAAREAAGRDAEVRQGGAGA